MTSDVVTSFKGELLNLLDETFATHHGIYLYDGTSLLETLDSVTAEEASAYVPDGCFCIAAHAEHVILYLDVVERSIVAGSNEDVDWDDIWLRVRGVTPAEWDDLRRRLREAYARIRAAIVAFEGWDGEWAVTDAMAPVVHTAYHLGSIRQLLSMVRAR